MAILPWQIWFDRAVTDADAKALAAGLRHAADNGEPAPSGMLSALAALLDPPVSHKGATLRLVRPRGGKSAAFDWIAIGRAAHEQIKSGDKRDSVIFEVARHFRCNERTARRALENYEIGIRIDNQTAD